MSKKWMGLAAAAVFALALGACADEPTAPQANANQPAFDLGNGYPVPSHDYQMQIIGVPKGKDALMTGNNGHRIFVLLNGGGEVTNPGGKNNHLWDSDVNKIFLCNSTANVNDVTGAKGTLCDAWRADGHVNDFGVIDANASDANGALFGIPDPCTDALITTACTPTYRIWARALAGKGSATITTCADETGSGFDLQDDIWCGSNGVTLSKQTTFKAVEVTNNLLYMTITVNDLTDPQLAACIGGPGATDGDADTYNVYLFDNCFENYFWNYDNNGLKNLQLRFYWAGSLL